MPKSGRIPDHLLVFLRDPIDYLSSSGRTVNCTPAFVTDVDRSNTHDTARRWSQEKSFNPSSTTIDNTPIQTVTLVNWEWRSEGSLTYKIVTPQGWLVDLRLDEFHEILFKKGISKTGELEGPFQWVINGSQMRLTVVGSRLHKEIEELDRISRQPRQGKIRVSDLKIGGVYAGSGPNAIYLGRCHYEGKIKCAWLFVSSEDAQKEYDEKINKTPWVTLTNGCTFIKKVGDVVLTPNLRSAPVEKYVEFENGYGERLLRWKVTNWKI